MDNPAPSQGKPATLFVDFAIERSVLRITPVGPSLGTREIAIVVQAVRNRLVALPSTVTTLVFDLSRVEFLNSMGLGMLIELRGHAHRQQLATAMINVNDQLTSVVKSMKIHRLIPICNTAKKLQRLLAA